MKVKRMKRSYLLPLFFFIMLDVLGCSQKQNMGTVDHIPVIGLEETIAGLEKSAEENKDLDVKARIHLELAGLYYQSHGAQCNYGKALEELEKYVLLAPHKSNSDEIRNLLAILREVNNQKKNNLLLKEEISRLKETINKLNSLDIKMEMKREKVKQQGP